MKVTQLGRYSHLQLKPCHPPCSDSEVRWLGPDPDHDADGQGLPQLAPLTVHREKSPQTSTGDPPTASLGELWILGLSALCCGEGMTSIMLTTACQLDSKPQDAQACGETLFLEEISICIGTECKAGWVGTIQPPEGPNRTKRWKKVEFSVLSECWARTLVPSCPQTRTHIIGFCFSGLWTLSGLDHHFPGSPACRWKTVGLLCLHNCVSQFLILYYLPHPPQPHTLIVSGFLEV